MAKEYLAEILHVIQNAVDSHFSELNMDTPEDNALKNDLASVIKSLLDFSIVRAEQLEHVIERYKNMSHAGVMNCPVVSGIGIPCTCGIDTLSKEIKTLDDPI